MKLETQVISTSLSNVGEISEFKIRATAKSFSILSSGLYSNKIKAIIRELSTNAWDSHIAAGKHGVPFEVHLPSVLEPWFSVRDFGVGLDSNQVTNVYSTYFESTKTDSNAFVGALGLGSKSPFSYTNNFTITAIKNGTKCIYSAFINDSGVPSVVNMATELSDDVNGVEVKFGVSNRYDYESFRYEAQQVFKWFKDKPCVTGTPFIHELPNYKDKDIIPGVHLLGNSSYSVALMGNIAYPLNKLSEPEKHFGDLAKLLTAGLLIEFSIGELDFAASREELSYIPSTIANIKQKLEKLNIRLSAYFAEKANAITCKWGRAEYLYSNVTSDLYKIAVREYAVNTKFELYDIDEYSGRKKFKFSDKDLTARSLTISGERISCGNYKYKVGANREYNSVSASYENTITIPVDSTTVLVLNDLKTGCSARARYHYIKIDGTYNVYCVSHSSNDLAVRQAEYDKLIKELHNPPNVVKASSLIKKEIKKRQVLSNDGILYLSKNTGYNRNRKQPDFVWSSYSATLDPNVTYYYVCLNSLSPETVTGNKFDMFSLKTLIDNSGIDDLKKIQIMGVRKSRIKDIKNLTNWIWIEDKVKEEINKLTKEVLFNACTSDITGDYYMNVYREANIVKLVDDKSDYVIFANLCNSIKHNSNGKTLLTLYQKYSLNNMQDIIDEFTAMKNKVFKKYPLLKHLCSAKSQDVAQYITLVDLSEKLDETI